MRITNLCPSCKTAMKDGFVVSAQGMWWNDHVPSSICRGSVKLARNFWGCSAVPGFRCDNCGLIVLRPKGSTPEKHEQIMCPNCGKVYSSANATLTEDGSLLCPGCGMGFPIWNTKGQ